MQQNNFPVMIRFHVSSIVVQIVKHKYLDGSKLKMLSVHFVYFLNKMIKSLLKLVVVMSKSFAVM